MFDVFYQGPKPNLFAFERPAESLSAADTLCRTEFFWYIDGDVNYENFDFNYRPPPWQSQYTHVWSTQWNKFGGAYLIPRGKSSSQEFHFHDRVLYLQPQQRNWNILIEKSIDFDWSWKPHPFDPPYNYIFGNQWWPPEKMPTVEYRVAGATESKFMDLPATLHECHDNHWHTLLDCEWDYSWCPDPGDPPYIYVFGNQWYPAEVMPTVEYHVLGATERKYLDQPKAKLPQDRTHWVVPEEIDASTIDFSWVPHPNDPPYIHHFGSDYQQSVGLTYTVPGATELKFEGEIPCINSGANLQVLDIFFIDKSNVSARQRYLRLQERYPNCHWTRYANNMLETIKRCLARSKTTKFWVISSECIYDDFDFAWHAEPWQSHMTHVFGSQWQKWSDTFLINRYEFERCASWCNSLEEFPNLNFVNDQAVVIPNDLYDIYWVDHGNANSLFEVTAAGIPKIKKTRFVSNYLDTLKRIMATASTEYVWVISSLCDYTRFDFSWQPEPWQREMIHVFASGQQSRGDTFYIHVESFKQQMVELELLDWFNVINYCDDQRVHRLPFETVEYTNDNLVLAVKQHEFSSPYAYFKPKTGYDDIYYQFDPCLWSLKDRKIHSLTTGNSSVFVPRDVKNYVDRQLYDYPYIEKQPIPYDEINLDVVYISNGEPQADHWYEHLCDIVRMPVKRVSGVNGRAAAYKAAANLSDTSWFFAVFAKLEVDRSFDWSWQPDRMQELKHYIFHARNPVNGLEYGHMGMIAYNRQLVLETNTWGLDFTLSKPHAVVPINSGVAHYNTSAELTWRTAFREVIKLNYDVHTTGSIENSHRLKTWTTVAQGDYAEWSIQGAMDAIEYCASVDFNYDKLLKSFEWDWLRQYWLTKHDS